MSFLKLFLPYWNATKEDIKKKALEHNETITPLNDVEFIEIEYVC